MTQREASSSAGAGRCDFRSGGQELGTGLLTVWAGWVSACRRRAPHVSQCECGRRGDREDNVTMQGGDLREK